MKQNFTKLSTFILLVLGLMFHLNVTAQSSIYSNVITATNPNTQNPFEIDQVFADNISVSGIGRGSGISGENANNRYNAKGWTTSASSINVNDYFYLTITPSTGYEVDFSNLIITLRRSGQGPQKVQIRSSVDDYTNVINEISLTASGADLWFDISLEDYDLQNITESITFRIYGFDADAEGGTMSVNDFNFMGEINALPSEVSIALDEVTSTTGCFGTEEYIYFTTVGADELTDPVYELWYKESGSTDEGELVTEAVFDIDGANVFFTLPEVEDTITYDYYVTIYDGGTPLAVSNSIAIEVLPFTFTQNITAMGTSATITGETTIIKDENCEVIAKVTSEEDLGNVTVATTTGSVGYHNEQPMLGRFYHIESDLSSDATSEVVLYFTQEEIDDYNNAPEVLDETYDAIDDGLANLKLMIYHGDPDVGGEGPNGYDTNGMQVVEPSSIELLADEDFTYYAVTFTMEGFSGVFGYTSALGTPLDVNLGDIYAHNNGKTNTLYWNTLDESEGYTFEAQKSTNSRDFVTIKSIKSQGVATQYSVEDDNISATDYYRVKLIDPQGNETISKTVSVSNTQSGFSMSAYPNPIQQNLTLVLTADENVDGVISVIDQLGRTINSINVQEAGKINIESSDWTSGIYNIVYQDGKRSFSIVVVKN